MSIPIKFGRKTSEQNIYIQQMVSAGERMRTYYTPKIKNEALV